MKRSSAQIQREIDQILARKTDRVSSQRKSRLHATAAKGPLIKTRLAAISLKQLYPASRQEIERIAEFDRPEPSWSLDPEDVKYRPVVRRTDKGFVVVDGYHRLAGMLLFGAERFPVIIVEAPLDLLRSIDTDSVIGECPPLDAIYEAAAKGAHST